MSDQLSTGILALLNIIVIFYLDRRIKQIESREKNDL